MPEARKATTVADILKKFNKDPIPEMADVGAEFLRLAGGAKNFSALLWQEFCDAEKGSLLRQRTLDMVLRCLKHAEARANDKGEYKDFADDELQEAIAESLAMFNKADGKGGDDAAE